MRKQYSLWNWYSWSIISTLQANMSHCPTERIYLVGMLFFLNSENSAEMWGRSVCSKNESSDFTPTSTQKDNLQAWRQNVEIFCLLVLPRFVWVFRRSFTPRRWSNECFDDSLWGWIPPPLSTFYCWIHMHILFHKAPTHDVILQIFICLYVYLSIDRSIDLSISSHLTSPHLTWPYLTLP